MGEVFPNSEASTGSEHISGGTPTKDEADTGVDDIMRNVGADMC